MAIELQTASSINSATLKTDLERQAISHDTLGESDVQAVLRALQDGTHVTLKREMNTNAILEVSAGGQVIFKL